MTVRREELLEKAYAFSAGHGLAVLSLRRRHWRSGAAPGPPLPVESKDGLVRELLGPRTAGRAGGDPGHRGRPRRHDRDVWSGWRPRARAAAVSGSRPTALARRSCPPVGRVRRAERRGLARRAGEGPAAGGTPHEGRPGRAHPRLALLRGALLDLLATDDRAGWGRPAPAPPADTALPATQVPATSAGPASANTLARASSSDVACPTPRPGRRGQGPQPQRIELLATEKAQIVSNSPSTSARRRWPGAAGAAPRAGALAAQQLLGEVGLQPFLEQREAGIVS